MQIQAIQNFQKTNQTLNPQFKAVYPVRYWVSEAKGKKYQPALTRNFSKFLNTKIVEMLNKHRGEITSQLTKLEEEKEGLKRVPKELERKIEKLKLVERVKNFISRRDKDYMHTPFVRAFNIDKSSNPQKNEPISYLITGLNAVYFEETFGKPIGRLKAQLENKYGAAEIEQAIADYWTKGFTYVKNNSNNFCRNGKPLELHVKMDTLRTKTGTIKGYKVVDMEFFPKNTTNDLITPENWANK